jgi:hypothetical protein
MRWYMCGLALAFAITLCVVTGFRVRAQGRAFSLGLASGAAASVPASLLAFCVTRGERQPMQKEMSRYPRLVILPGMTPPRPLGPPEYPPLSQARAPAPARPRYRIVGEEAT